MKTDASPRASAPASESQSELRNRGEQLETLINQAPIGIYLVDSEFRIAQVNTVARPVFGDIADLLGRDFDEVMHILWEKSYADEVCDLFRRTLETGEPYDTPERAHIRADRGVTEYYSWRIDRITLPDGSYGVVCYFSDVSEQVRARLIIEVSEKKYRALFETIDQGFCIVEVIFDDSDYPVDFRYLEANSAYGKHTGLIDTVGRTLREAYPAAENLWPETFGRIARTGEAERFVEYGKAVNRWYDTFAFPTGEPGQNRVGILFQDITERKLNEQLLRESEERQAFLLELSDALRPLADPVEVRRTAMVRVGQQFGVQMAAYTEFDEDQDRGVISESHGSLDVQSPIKLRLTDFGPHVAGELMAGRTVVYEDVETDPRLSDSLDAYRVLNIASGVGIPLIKGGRLVAAFAVNHTKPRRWTRSEVTLLEESAERTWGAVERARAEKALRAAEESHRAIFTGTSAGFVVLAPDAPRFTIMDVNDAYLNATKTRREDLIGRALFEVFPENPDDPNATNVRDLHASLDRVLATKRRDVLPRLKYDIPKPGGGFEERWWDPIQTPLLGRDGAVTAIIHHATEQTDTQRAEEALRKSEERQAFLLKLSDALRPLRDPVEIQGVATRLLREHVQVGWCYYADFDKDGTGVDILRDSVREGLPSLVGHHDMHDLPELIEHLAAGLLMIAPDLSVFPFFNARVVERYTAIGMHSFIGAPVVKDGRLITFLMLADSEVCQWSGATISLLNEVADRTWAAVERARTEDSLRASEEDYRSLFETMGQGYAEQEIVRDAAGRAIDLRLVKANSRLETLTGLDRATAVGKLSSEFLPSLEPSWIERLDRVARSGEPAQFEEKVAALGRWYHVQVHPRGSDRLALLYDDVTERKRAEAVLRQKQERQEFLLKLSDALRPLVDAADVEGVATRLLREHFDVGWCYYLNYNDELTEGVALRDSHREGLSSLAGTHDVSDVPEFIEHCQSGQILNIPKWKDSPLWTQRAIDQYISLGFKSLLGAPLLKHGRLKAVLLLIDTKEREWPEDALSLIADVAERTWTAIEGARAEADLRQTQAGLTEELANTKQLEERQTVLVAELQHRTRNLIGVVRSMGDKTARASADLPDFQDRFRDRLDALARTQGLLSRLNDYDRVTFDELISTELAAINGSAEQVTVAGPEGVRLRSSTVQTLAMALHELATNAIKYGALHDASGRLAITWRLDPAGEGGRTWLHIDWRESGVTMPASGQAPTGTGQGRELIERALPYQLSAKTTYDLGPDGVHCTISIPVSASLAVVDA